MDRADAVPLLAAFAAGWSDDVPPLLAVAGPGRLDVPPLLPAVVVVAAGSADGDPGADVALTTAAGAPPPWVAVDDLRAGLEAVARAVAASPVAAVTLAQLLRASAGAKLEDGLLMESQAYSVLQGGPEFGAWRAEKAALYPPKKSGEPAVVTSRRGDRLEVTLNRPEVHNAYNRAMRDLLCEALAVAAADPAVTVSLAGRGPSFCSGGDLAEFGTAPDPATAHLVRTSRSPARLIASLSPRVRATIHGSCAGSGIELPAFAGTVRARPGTRIWLPELAMGLIPGAGGTVSLTRRMGRARTAWLALTGSVIDGETALSWGLVDELLDESRSGSA